MSTFDIKKFLINEGMTRVSRDRKRLLKEAEESRETAEIIYRGFTIHKNGNVTVDEYPYEEVESPYNYPSEEAWTWYFDNNPWIMKSSELEYDTPYLVALPEAFGEQVEENAVAELDFKGKVYCFYLESDADELIYGSDDSEMRANLNTQLAGLGRNLSEVAPAGWTEDEWEEYRSRKEAEKIFRQGGAGDRRGAINRSAMGNQQGRRRGLKGSTQAPTWLVSENVTDQDYETYREWQKDNGWDDETIDAAIEIWKQHPDMFAIELENPVVDDLEAFVAEPELYLSGDPEDLATAVKRNIYRR